MLARAKKFARTTLLQIALRDFESIGSCDHGFDAVARIAGDRFRCDENAVRFLRASANPPTQLMKLCEDGRPLPALFAPLKEIRQLGQGRCTLDGGLVYFSATDNTDPTTNGRKYTLRWIAPIAPLGSVARSVTSFESMPP